eukprot:TRINITY_DN28405_c0_g1_i2.p1 TRINITY_DN28405_c0_g1~~TRINITY_DN28405_c0_g1_i2.p1  ORF type:complete len:260 (+),score=45.93 TRINITY_DN28405_c0_g1_i2:126-905(+)
MIRRPPRSTLSSSSAASDVYKRQNAGYRMVATVPSPLERELVQIPGVPGAGTPIPVELLQPRFGDAELLPTGRAVDSLVIPSGAVVDATLACGANPTVFVKAAQLGFKVFGQEYNANVAATVDALRAQGAMAMGVELTAAVRVCWVDAPVAYTASDGKTVCAEDTDLVGCISTPGRIHHAFTGTGAINLAGMACIDGTVVQQCSRAEGGTTVRTRLGHPGGVMQVQAECSVSVGGVSRLERAGFVRTCLLYTSPSPRDS